MRLVGEVMLGVVRILIGVCDCDMMIGSILPLLFVIVARPSLFSVVLFGVGGLPGISIITPINLDLSEFRFFIFAAFFAIDAEIAVFPSNVGI